MLEFCCCVLLLAQNNDPVLTVMNTDGVAVAGAHVYIDGSAILPNGQFRTTDANGQTSLNALGKRRIRITREGYTPSREVEFDLVEGMTYDFPALEPSVCQTWTCEVWRWDPCCGWIVYYCRPCPIVHESNYCDPCQVAARNDVANDIDDTPITLTIHTPTRRRTRVESEWRTPSVARTIPSQDLDVSPSVIALQE